MTDDGTNSFLEVNFTQSITGLEIGLQYIGGHDRGTLYSGDLPVGGGTVRVTTKANGLFVLSDKFIVESTGNVGIGTTEPGAKLEVAGQVKITGGSPGANKVLTSDASGLATWQASSGLPSGSIIMYSGPWNFDGTGLGINTLLGWALCNGNNGTPNLSDKFVMGTTSSSSLGEQVELILIH